MSNFDELKRLETAYVVKLHNFVQLAMEKPCFTFRHPNPDLDRETHNKRHVEVDFRVDQASKTRVCFGGVVCVLRALCDR